MAKKTKPELAALSAALIPDLDGAGHALTTFAVSLGTLAGITSPAPAGTATGTLPALPARAVVVPGAAATTSIGVPAPARPRKTLSASPSGRRARRATASWRR